MAESTVRQLNLGRGAKVFLQCSFLLLVTTNLTERLRGCADEAQSFSGAFPGFFDRLSDDQA